MAYLALYRIFRPTTLNDVVRQEHIVTVLKNQIETGRVGHAYLFCGPRGTGKTSIAKIFAAAINCDSPIEGSPCGKCARCVALKNPANLDITEIDAASNNGVDEMRDLREKVQYPPVAGKYKVNTSILPLHVHTFLYHTEYFLPTQTLQLMVLFSLM